LFWDFTFLGTNINIFSTELSGLVNSTKPNFSSILAVIHNKRATGSERNDIIVY
jgi:hypothetical protein